MPLLLSSTGGLALTNFIVSLLSGLSAYKIVIRRDEKERPIFIASWFASGVILGTAMMDFMIDSNVIFHAFLNFQYPLAFLIFCIGYAVAMLVDGLLTCAIRRLTWESFTKSNPKFLDKIIIGLVSDFQPTKYRDTPLPVVASNSNAKDCGGFSYHQNLTLSRATAFGHGFFLYFTFSMLSDHKGLSIRRAQTKTMLSIILHNITYAVSLVFAVQSMPLVPVIGFSVMGALGNIISEFISSGIDSILGTGSSGSGVETNVGAWFGGIYAGFSAGVMVYLSVHHLLVDGNELINSDARFKKFVAVVFGIGVIALLKVLEM